MGFEPDILGFACNWCGYAGADGAGQSKLTYPTNIKLLRVMCLGRVDTAFLLKAFEDGYDGVCLIGCHIGDCHYVSGNKNAVEVVDNIKNILNTMGLDGRRLRIEEVSSAEGPKFAEVVNEFTEELKKLGPNPLKIQNPKTQVQSKSQIPNQKMSKRIEPVDLQCIQCNKCTHFCPQNRVDEKFSPRGMVLKALKGEKNEMKSAPEIWQCLTCLRCKEVCASGTQWVDYVRELRVEAKGEGLCFDCKHGKIIQTMQKMMASPDIKQKRLSWAEGLEYADKGEYFYFTGCLPYFDNIFTFANHTNIAKSTLKLLNRSGIKPVLSNNERCCGYEVFWNGDNETFEKLAKLNIETIKNSGAKKVITSCAECFRTLKADYKDLAGELPFEVIHTTTFLADLIKEGKLRFTSAPSPLEGEGQGEGKIATYHDPCRLGRYEKIYDAPRDLLKAIPGLELKEMERNRADALCCGVGNFSNCDADTKFLQHDRLMEAKGVGATTLVTSCPKCRIHYSCYLDGRPVEELEGLEIKDIVEVAAEALV